MKKFLLCILTLLTTVFLVSCSDLFNVVEDFTDVEKMAILEEVEYSSNTHFNMGMDFQLAFANGEEHRDVKALINIYTNLSLDEDFIALLNYDLNLDMPEAIGSLKGMFYLNQVNAYLDLNADLNLNAGSFTFVTNSKEVLPYSKYLDFEDIKNQINAILSSAGQEIDWDEVWDQDFISSIPAEFLEDLLQYMDFIKTKNGYKVRVNLNKEKIMTIEALKESLDLEEMLEKMDNKSFLKFEFVIDDNKVNKITLKADIKIQDEDLSIAYKFDFVFEIGKEVVLPSEAELAEFKEVDKFSILNRYSLEWIFPEIVKRLMQ